MKYAFALMALIASAGAHAALAPYYDSGRKIQAVLANAEVANSLKMAPIKQIDVNGLIVIIEAGTCARFVTLEAVAPAGGMAGPTNYNVASISDNPCD